MGNVLYYQGHVSAVAVISKRGAACRKLIVEVVVPCDKSICCF